MTTTSDARPVRRAVSLAITSPPRPGQICLVLRPEDDPELPGIWGLPATRVRPAESLEEAAIRAARDKLGVIVRGLRVLNEGATDRPNHRLEMRLFEAEIASGAPRTPQPGAGGTQYVAWRWGSPGALGPGAEAGSLCCRLRIEADRIREER